MQLGEQLERLQQKLAAEQAARYLIQHKGRSGKLALACAFQLARVYVCLRSYAQRPGLRVFVPKPHRNS